MEPTFVHLNLHSEYSLSDSLIRIKPLVGAVVAAAGAAEAGLPGDCVALVRMESGDKITIKRSE